MEWLNYHHLLYFWVVSKEGSVSRAAELLHVTPATVSIQVRELENSLGVKLFRKSGRGLALTETGEAVFHYAKDIFSLGRELIDMVKGRPVGRPLLLRVGVAEVMPKLVAHKLIEPAFHLPEKMRLVCQEGTMAQLVADLSIHKLDVVLSESPLDPTLKVRAFSHLLGESEICFMAVKEIADPLREGFPQSLNRAPMLLPTPNTSLRRSLDLWFQDHQIAPDIRGEFSDSAMMKIVGRSGAGVVVVPETIVEEVQAMFGFETIGKADGVRERYFALSVDRKLKHPGVLAISQGAKPKLRELETSGAKKGA